MKFRHSLIIGCLTALLGFGAFLGAGVSKEAKVEKAEAKGTITFSAGTIIYLDPSSFDPNNNWTGGYLGAWCWYKDSGHSTDMWEEFSYDNLSGKYYFALSYASTGFTMARYGGSSRQGNTSWGDNPWNSGDFAFVTGKNYLYANGWFTGEWQTLTYHLAGDYNGWNGTDSSYVMTDGFDDNGVHQARIEITTTNTTTEVKVTSNYNGTVASGDWYGTLINGYNGIYVGPKDGNILLKKAATYELYFKYDGGSRKVWAQIASNDEATLFASDFITTTDSICSVGGTSANHASALAAVWNAKEPADGTSLVEKWNLLSSGAKTVFKNGTLNATVTDANQRYIHIMERYNNLTEFSGGPNYTPKYSVRTLDIKSETNDSVFAIVVSAFVATIAAAGFVFLRKKKSI